MQMRCTPSETVEPHLQRSIVSSVAQGELSRNRNNDRPITLILMLVQSLQIVHPDASLVDAALSLFFLAPSATVPDDDGADDRHTRTKLEERQDRGKFGHLAPPAHACLV